MHAGRTEGRAAQWRSVTHVAALIALAATLRVWHIRHTEVTARDGVGFIRYAWQLGTQPWDLVLRENAHPPLYPLTILAASWPVRHLAAGSEAALMQLSAQVASGAAGVLLVVPMYFFGRRLFGPRVGFWSAALFQCLPVSSRTLSDALSEGVYFLMLAVALALAARGFDHFRPGWFALAGLFGGLAFLTRPEGALVVVALVGVLAGCALAGLGATRPRTAGCAAGCAIAAVAVALPYVAVIGHVTNKTTGIDVLRAAAGEPAGEYQTGTGPRLAAPLAVYWSEVKNRQRLLRLAWSLSAVGGEALRDFCYFGWLPAILAVYWYWGRFYRRPLGWLVCCLNVMQTLLLWRVAYVAGYLAERHTLLFVFLGLPWAVAGTCVVGAAAARLVWRKATAAGRSGRLPAWLADGRAWAVAMLLAGAGIALPRTLEPLHANRAGYHAAGLWLAEHADARDEIVDPFCWAELYSGRLFREEPPAPDARCFVVLGGSDNEHRRLPLIPHAEALARAGRLVYEWPEVPTRTKAERVVVYCVPPAGR